MPILRAILSGCVALRGDGHPTTVVTRVNLANALIDGGRPR
ncbi:hypothetical protein [Streptomyces griseoloalbus]|uniref:Uncharacterized protein n=1 Tax=Streptomyces griseoloalbus TaxID=67303 RepID=A0A7W8F9L7_9ACTN|nr:hypothetical protein [Streptomyces albaduncus]MBB5126409.1 hypothetical protein [Streptomyces albaduncus]GGW35156.1 hypothetical protein GCM10010340_11010 [Streptomyces albaduncus]